MLVNIENVIIQVGVRRPAGDEIGAGEQHPMRLRHPLVREHEGSLRPLQPRHRLRRCTGKLLLFFVCRPLPLKRSKL